jgi:hypothetical protein
MSGLDDSRKPTEADPTLAVRRDISLLRGFAWAIPLGVCGFLLPFVVFGVERVLRFILDSKPPTGDVVTDGAPSSVVCSFVFASSGVACFSVRQGIGYIRSLIAMSLNAILAWIAAGAIWVFVAVLFGPLLHGNVKEARTFFAWFFLEYQYLLFFPMTFLPGAIALVSWQISSITNPIAKADLPPSSAVVRRVSRGLNVFVKLWLCVGLLLALMIALRPVFSQSRIRLLAEGVVLWHGRPLGGVALAFYPVLDAGRLGQPARQENQLQTESDGHFLILTWPEWRKANPSKGEFAVTVSPAPDDAGQPRISAEAREAIRSFASPQDTTIRVTIVARNRSGLRIELSEWCSRRDGRKE